MANTILILGNGFDIAMGRKTKYTDFIEFEQRLFTEPDSDLRAFLNSKKIYIDQYDENVYLKFINENKDRLGENWSNLEIMISRLVDAMMYLKKHSNELFIYIGLDYYDFDDVVVDYSNYVAKYFIIQTINEKIK